MLTLSFSGFEQQVADEGHIITEYPSFSDDNEYIPITALSDGTLYSTNKRKLLFFNLETVTLDRMLFYRKFEQFSQVLFSGTRWVCLSHASIGEINRYAALANNLIYFNNETGRPEPLLTMCVRREFLFEINREHPNPDHFCLVIDKKFIDNENHFKVYRNVKKYFIDIVEKDVDVIYARNLLKLCYNDKIFAPKAKTVTELLEHYKSINSILIESIKSEAV